MKSYKGFVAFMVSFIWCLLTLSPLYFVFKFSLEPENEIFSPSFKLFPETLYLKNYEHLFSYTYIPFARIYLNSAIVSLTSSLIVLILSLFAAYAFSRFRFKGRNAFLVIIAFCSTIPSVFYCIPFFDVFAKLHLIDTYLALIIAYIPLFLPIPVWMIKSYFDSVPKEIEEAAIIDGASYTRILLRITLPLAAPGIVAAFVCTFAWAWGEFLLSYILTSSPDMRTLPVGLQLFISKYRGSYGILSAGTLLATFPTVILYGFLQKYIIQGLTRGALKG